MPGLHRRRKRTTSTDDYAGMLARMIRAYGTRIGADPEAGLGHLRDLEAAMADAANFGIYTANRVGGHSINELADVLGVSKQAVHKRVGLGELIAKRKMHPSLKARAARPRELPSGSTGD